MTYQHHSGSANHHHHHRHRVSVPKHNIKIIVYTTNCFVRNFEYPLLKYLYAANFLYSMH